MITVYVAPTLVDAMLRTGNIIQGNITIYQGLPSGSYFIGCRYNLKLGLIELEFYDPEPGPHRTIQVAMSCTRIPVQ